MLLIMETCLYSPLLFILPSSCRVSELPHLGEAVKALGPRKRSAMGLRSRTKRKKAKRRTCSRDQGRERRREMKGWGREFRSCCCLFGASSNQTVMGRCVENTRWRICARCTEEKYGRTVNTHTHTHRFTCEQ